MDDHNLNSRDSLLSATQPISPQMRHTMRQPSTRTRSHKPHSSLLPTYNQWYLYSNLSINTTPNCFLQKQIAAYCLKMTTSALKNLTCLLHFYNSLLQYYPKLIRKISTLNQEFHFASHDVIRELLITHLSIVSLSVLSVLLKDQSIFLKQENPFYFSSKKKLRCRLKTLALYKHWAGTSGV